MKFDCGLTWGEKLAAKKEWHAWFAWHPVRLGESHECRWLEYVARKGQQEGYEVEWKFDYRELTDASR